jgi:hypothetical protein
MHTYNVCMYVCMYVCLYVFDQDRMNVCVSKHVFLYISLMYEFGFFAACNFFHFLIFKYVQRPLVYVCMFVCMPGIHLGCVAVW